MACRGVRESHCPLTLGSSCRRKPGSNSFPLPSGEGGGQRRVRVSSSHNTAYSRGFRSPPRRAKPLLTTLRLPRPQPVGREQRSESRRAAYGRRVATRPTKAGHGWPATKGTFPRRCTTPRRAADRASKARMFEAMDGRVRAGARSASTKGSRADTMSARPSCPAQWSFAPFCRNRKGLARRRGERNKTKALSARCSQNGFPWLQMQTRVRTLAQRFAPPSPEGRGKEPDPGFRRNDEQQINRDSAVATPPARVRHARAPARSAPMRDRTRTPRWRCAESRSRGRGGRRRGGSW